MSVTGTEGVRWVFDPADSFAHVLADRAAQPGVLLTMCEREFPATTPTFPVAPSLAVCPICQPHGQIQRPPVLFPAPRPAAQPIGAPGGARHG